ncbi:mitochondrial protein Pet127-domain-containing protein, partial [Schizophyllum commune]
MLSDGGTPTPPRLKRISAHQQPARAPTHLLIAVGRALDASLTSSPAAVMFLRRLTRVNGPALSASLSGASSARTISTSRPVLPNQGAPRATSPRRRRAPSSSDDLIAAAIKAGMPVDPSAPLDPEAERRLRKTLKQKVRRARKREERNQARAREQSSQAYDATSELQTEDWGQDALQPKVKRGRPRSKSPSPPEHKGWDLGAIATPPPRGSSLRHKPSKPERTLQQLAYNRRIEGLIEPEAEPGPVLEDIPPRSAHKPIARLAHGLDRVLFNPGVHWMRDPRSSVYNFTPDLEHLPKVTDFAFERVEGFVKSSRDEDLRTLALREGKSFAGSTSSLTGMLSHIYFLISGDRNVDISPLSRAFEDKPVDFTPGQRSPASTVFNYKDGVHMIDSDEDKPGVKSEQNILTWMGTLLEKYFTMEPEEFARYLRAHDHPQTESDNMREAYRYSKSQTFIMRSQLDCVDPRLPGTGVFDMKTRACMAIRMDLLNFEESSGYLIRQQHGLLESFEREYYDLIRSAFLKYSFQARIGNMDGIFCAYHNVARVFGFQYFGLEEIDARLFGMEPGAGDRVFRKCVAMLETVAEEVAGCFPGQSVKATWETEEGTGVLHVWVQPVDWVGVEEEKPIVELAVTSASYLGDKPVKGYVAVPSVNKPWTIHYTISRSSDTFADIRKRLAAARERQTFAMSLPTGISRAQISEFLANLNFGGPAGEAEATASIEGGEDASRDASSNAVSASGSA